MAKKKNDGYLSAKESRRIAKENRKITDEFEKRYKRKNVPESEYLTEMKDPANALEIDDLHTYFFTDVGTAKAVDGVSFEVPQGATGTVEVAHSVSQVLGKVEGEEETFIMGGATVYRAFLPWVKRLYVTWVYGEFEADVYFPVIDPSLFRQVSITPRMRDPESGLEYAYAEYVRLVSPTGNY